MAHHTSLLKVAQIEKVFDVACTLIDVMSCVPLESRKFEPGPQEYLNSLLNVIATLRGGESRYLPLVTAKIRDTLPAIGTQLPQHLVSKTAGMDRLGIGVSLRNRVEEFKQEPSEEDSPSGTRSFIHYYPLV